MLDWLFFAVVGALIAAAVLIRRVINDPDSAFGQWYQARAHHRLTKAGKAVLYLTVAIWFIIYLSAPEEDRGSLGDLFKGLFQFFGGNGDEGAP